jgi:uncharacterized membrane protein (DUF485 family)
MDNPVDADDVNAKRNARYGLVLFSLYLLLYGGFMAWNVYDFKSMSQPIALLGGVNVAVVYGFGLIVAALVLAAVYMVLCRTKSDK